MAIGRPPEDRRRPTKDRSNCYWSTDHGRVREQILKMELPGKKYDEIILRAKDVFGELGLGVKMRKMGDDNRIPPKDVFGELGLKIKMKKKGG